MTADTAAIRVLHVDAGRRWAGGQNQVRLLCRELARRPVAQRCLCPRGSPLAERLAAEGLRADGIGWRGGADPRALWAVLRRIGGCDVIHCHDAHALQLALLPARFAGVPVVASRRVHFSTNALVWNRAARVIAISEVVRDALLRSGVDEARIRVVPSGVDEREVAGLPPLDPPLRRRLGIPGDAVVVGNIGYLQGYKGQEVIPEAAARTPEAHWVIIGDGPRRTELEARIRRHGVADRVHLAGYLPDARRALRELDVFVFPSVNEPLGSSVLDALAAGVPVVGADAAGPAEILGPVHRSTGASLVAPGDAAGLADRVHALASDPALRDRTLEAQRRRLETYRIATTAARTFAVYEELVDDGG